MLTETPAPSGSPFRLVELDGRSDPALLDELYEAVLRPSFHDDVLVSKDVLAAGIAAGEGEREPLLRVAVALDLGNSVVGGIICEWSPHSRVFLLSYLAARPGMRGGGLGGLLMGQLPRWYERLYPCAVLAEVDDPRFHPADPEHGAPEARLRFYTRHGARLLDVPYIQPRLAPGGRRAHGMLVLVLHVDEPLLVGGAACPSLAGDPLRTWMTDYVLSAEGETALSDPEIIDQLDRLGASHGVSVVPVGRYTEIPSLGRAAS